MKIEKYYHQLYLGMRILNQLWLRTKTHAFIQILTNVFQGVCIYIYVRVSVCVDNAYTLFSLLQPFDNINRSSAKFEICQSVSKTSKSIADSVSFYLFIYLLQISIANIKYFNDGRVVWSYDVTRWNFTTCVSQWKNSFSTKLDRLSHEIG